MQICSYRKTCNAHPHERHFQLCFGICIAGKRISMRVCDAAVLSNQHYTADGNLSCKTPKFWRLVLHNYQLDYGVVGTFLHRIRFLARTPNAGEDEQEEKQGAFQGFTWCGCLSWAKTSPPHSEVGKFSTQMSKFFALCMTSFHLQGCNAG